jgi:hypothetical protein
MIINELDVKKARAVSVFDLGGKLVFQTNTVEPLLQIGDLARGVYLVKITFDQGELSRKIVVQ